MLKLKLMLLTTLIACSAFADGGLYMGLGAGYGTINTNTTNGFAYLDGASAKGGGNLAGGLMLGYDFNRYLGVQSDYDYIANVQYTTGSSIPGVSGSFNGNQQLLDLGIIAHLPFILFSNNLSGLSLFAKLAIGYSFTNFIGGMVAATAAPALQISLPANSSSLVPVAGLGIEYGVNSVGVRLEYDYIGNTTIVNNNQTLMNVQNSLTLLSVFYHF